MDRLTAISRNIFLGGIISLPISIAMAQTLVYASLLLFLADTVQRRRQRNNTPRPAFRSALTPVILLFCLAVVISIFTGIDPARSAKRAYRLSLFLLVFAIPWWFAQSSRSSTCQPLATGNSNLPPIGNLFGNPFKRQATAPTILAAFVIGCIALAIQDVIRIRLEMNTGTPLPFTGNMRDPQFYMVAILLLTVFIVRLPGFPTCCGPRKPDAPPLLRSPHILALILILYCILGMLLHQKRGSMLALGATFVLLGLLTRKWKPVLLLAVVAASVLAIHQPTRERVFELRKQFSNSFGGRFTLWTEIGPAFIADHPFGAGFKATRFEDFQQYVGDNHIETGLDHLHNNAYQILAELGWFGLATWIPLVLLPLWLLWRRRASPLALAALLALIALLVNGLVEYNFGDSEIFMLICTLFGLANHKE